MGFSFKLLCKACKRQDFNEIEKLLRKGVNINKTLANGDTLLHSSIKWKYENLSIFLIDHGACVDFENEITRRTPLHLACKYGSEKTVDRLLTKGAVADLYTEDTEDTPLHIACRYNHLSVIRILLDHGATFDLVNCSGYCAPHVACKYCGSQAIELFLNKGFYVNCALVDRTTPLHIASEWGNVDVVKFLIEKGANINAESNAGTPLSRAAENHFLEVVEILLQSKADLSICNIDGDSPLHLACFNKGAGVYEVRSTVCYDSYQTMRKYSTKFVPYGGNKHLLQVIELLIIHGADLDLKNNSGQTPLHMACTVEANDVTKHLLHFGANVNCIDKHGKTPLAIAYSESHKIILQHLLNYGASLKVLGTNFYRSKGYNAKNLKSHLLKTKALNLSHNELDYYKKMFPGFEEHLNKCLNEVEELKQEKFHNSVISYYDFLVKNNEEVAKLLKNKVILMSVSSCTKFPIYSSMLENNLKNGYKRLVLSNISLKYLNILSKYKLNIFIIDMIMSFLDNTDLENLINAFCNQNNSSS